MTKICNCIYVGIVGHRPQRPHRPNPDRILHNFGGFPISPALVTGLTAPLPAPSAAEGDTYAG